MYQDVTSSYAEKINNESRTFIAKLEFSSGDVMETDVRSIKLTSQANSGTDTVEIGGVVSTQLDIEAHSPDFSITGKEFKLYFGLQLDGNVEYVPMGVFIPQKPTYSQDKSIVTFTAYDRMVSKLEKAYNTEIEKYPADAKNILQEISTMSGVPIGNLDALPDGLRIKARTDQSDTGKQISAPFSGCTYREAIGYIAQMYGMFSTINRNGELELRWYKDVNYEINNDRIFEGEFSDKYTLKKIECATSSKTLTAGKGETGISISNPLMTQAILDGIFEKIGNMSYLPYVGTYLGDPRIELGDIITVNGNKVPVMSIKHDFDGGITTEIGCYGNTEEEENNPNGPTQSKLDKISEELSNIGENVVYEYTNSKKLTITSAEQNIILIRYMASKDTKAEFKAEILVNVNATQKTVTANDASGNTITFLSDGKAVLVLTYRINNEKLVTHIPVETLQSGKHIITLFYQINSIKGDSVNRFEVLAQIEGGTAVVEVGGIIATISGNGFVGEVDWDGTIEIEEKFKGISLDDSKVKLGSFAETIIAKTKGPDTEGFAEQFAGIALTDSLIEIAGMKEMLGSKYTIRTHTISTQYKQRSVYSQEYVNDAEDTFKMRTDYKYISEEQTIDSGRMETISLDFTQYTAESVVIS